MNGRIMSVVSILLLFLLIVGAGYALISSYKTFYKRNNLLRVDPLEYAGVKTDNLESVLNNSDIWMIGDSRVKRWPEELLNTTKGIANLGVEGQTSAQVYCRLKNYLETDTPSLIILEVGINDLKIIGIDKDLADYITGQFYGNIESMIKLCKDRNIRMILINVFAVGKIEMSRRLVWNRSVSEIIIDVNMKLKSYGDDNNIFYFDADEILSENMLKVKPEYQDDFLHINTRGYEALSGRLTDRINNVLNEQK